MKLTQRSGTLLSLIILATACLALGVFTNVISDMWGEDIQQIFWGNKWLLVVLAVALAFLGYWYSEGLKKEQKQEAETIDEDRFEKALREFRQELITQYQIRLNNKVTDRLPINLAARSTGFGTSEERIRLYFDHKTIESRDIAGEAGKILETVRRLLIIGDPGAGKTTIVLYTALALLRDESNPKLPLILNLATWHQYRDFESWYVQNAAQSYNLSPVFVRNLIRRNLLVPVFDGFDEINEDHRDDCFVKMKAWFGDLRERRMIICSRKKEYADAKTDAPVYCELEVQPLRLAQIKSALSENAERQAADRALLDALEQDEHLCKAVETPFYLNTASFLFSKGEKTLTDFNFQAKESKGRQLELVKCFVEQQVPYQQHKAWLSFLAWEMQKKELVVFEMSDLRPELNKNARRYRILTGLCFAFVFTVVGLLLESTLSGLLFYMLFGLWGGFDIWFESEYTNKKYLFLPLNSYQRFRKRFMSNIKDFVPQFILVIIIFPIGLYFEAQKRHLKFEVALRDPEIWKIVLLIVFTGFIMAPISDSGFIQHFSARLLLYLEHKIPLRLVTFLDRMSDQRILEDNRRIGKNGKKMRGASWRFRHKILQDYFANLEIRKDKAS